MVIFLAVTARDYTDSIVPKIPTHTNTDTMQKGREKLFHHVFNEKLFVFVMKRILIISLLST